MAKAKPMTKDEAVREARIASSYKGGTWFVTRRGKNYGVVAADMYDSKLGRVAETIDIHAERMSARLSNHEGLSEVLEIETKHARTVRVTKDVAPELFAAWRVWANAQAARVATSGDWSSVLHEANRHLDTCSDIDKGDHTDDVRVAEPGVETAIAITKQRAAESGHGTANHLMSTYVTPPSKAVQNALKLAYIKLVQTGGFDQVDGVKTPDVKAREQILDAIHTFDPAFDFKMEQ